MGMVRGMIEHLGACGSIDNGDTHVFNPYIRPSHKRVAINKGLANHEYSSLPNCVAMPFVGFTHIAILLTLKTLGTTNTLIRNQGYRFGSMLRDILSYVYCGA